MTKYGTLSYTFLPLYIYTHIFMLFIRTFKYNIYSIYSYVQVQYIYGIYSYVSYVQVQFKYKVVQCMLQQ